MKTTLLTIATAILMASAAKAQNLTNTAWTSLNEHLYIESDDGKNNIKAFDVDCYTDGGGLPGDAEMKRVSPGVFVVRYIESNYKPSTRNKLMSVDCPETGKTEYLYQETMDGKFLHILAKVEDGKSQQMRIQEFYDAINGTYTDKDGKKYVFNNDVLTIDGKKMTIKPKETAYDGYSNGFVADNGTHYCFMISETGINLYTAKYDEQDESETPIPDKLWVQLRADLDANQGRWQFTNQKIIMERHLYRYSKSLLRLMRNEIYARHGYKFASADLAAYFAKTSWYSPVSDNSKIKLSALEQLNVSIIKRVEDAMNQKEIDEGKIEKGL
jgi:hypothetical protein